MTIHGWLNIFQNVSHGKVWILQKFLRQRAGRPRQRYYKDGLLLLKEIREMDPMIKVILLSGIDSAKNVREAFRTGAVDFLFKPVDTDALKKLIGTTIESI